MDICMYYELIVFLYVGANTFWDFLLFRDFTVPQTVDCVFCCCCFFVYFDESESQLESQIARTLQNRKIIAAILFY